METRNKINKSLSKKVIQQDLDGNFIKEWTSIKEASEKLGLSPSNITKCCNGKYKKVGKFRWVTLKSHLKSVLGG